MPLTASSKFHFRLGLSPGTLVDIIISKHSKTSSEIFTSERTNLTLW